MGIVDVRQGYSAADGTLTSAEHASPAVAWSAIIGGAFAAVAISLIMVALGAGIGFASISPWQHGNMSATAVFTAKTAIWFIIMQWIASGLGGYLAGRLRTKWVGLHTDEVFFRDTAQGFLSWALATVVTAIFLASSAFSLINGGIHAASSVASGAAAKNDSGGTNRAEPNAYFVDTLFRVDHPAVVNDIHAESGRILAMGMKNGNFSDQDKSYLAQLVSTQTGLSQPDAMKRVDDTIAQINAAEENARQTAEAVRKTSEKTAFFTFFSLLVGAFIACVAGALGGKRRDEY